MAPFFKCPLTISRAAMATPAPASPSSAAPAVPPLDALALRHVMFFHRHGDRAPILTSVGSKWQMTREERAFWASRTATPAQLAALNRVAVVVGDDPSMPPHGVPRHRDMAPLAHLTAQGVDHMIAKGRALRAQYDAFVTAHALDEAPHDRVYVLSSNVDRTIQSVQCLLRGMFYPETDGPERPAFHVRTQAVNRLAPAHPITIFNEIERIVSHEVEKRDPAERAKMEQLGDVLREIVGVPSDQPVPWTAIRDGLTCRRANGLAFPEGITDDMYATMCEYDSWLWHQLFAQKPFCFNAYEHGVRQVHALLQSITDKEQAPETKPVLSFFSAHDNSIVALVSALQLQVERVLPGYGTVVAFEIYEAPDTGKFYVRTLFEGKPVAFAGHEHSALCPFEHFDALAKQFLKGPDATQETTD